MNAINLWNVLRIGGKKIERTLCLTCTFYNSSINLRLWGTPWPIYHSTTKIFKNAVELMIKLVTLIILIFEAVGFNFQIFGKILSSRMTFDSRLQSMKPKVVIVGGSFAGLCAARYLRRHVNVTIVEPRFSTRSFFL